MERRMTSLGCAFFRELVTWGSSESTSFLKDCSMSDLQQDDFMGGEAIKTAIHYGAQPHLGDGCCLCLSCYHALHSSSFSKY